MDERQRQQVELIIGYELESARKAVENKSRAIYAAHSAKGILGSGVTVKVVNDAIGDTSSRLLSSLIEKVGTISKSPSAMDLIASAMDSHFANMDGEVLKSARLASRSATRDPIPSVLMAAQGILAQIKADIAAKVEIERFVFDGSSDTLVRQQDIPVRKLPRNTGGKPLAEHWDRMWAAIAFKLWNGELEPTRQKVITDAMNEWFDNEKIDVGSTAVTERARALWQLIEAERMS